MLIWIEDHPGLGSWVQAIAGLLAVLTALGIAVWESRRSAKSTRDALAREEARQQRQETRELQRLRVLRESAAALLALAERRVQVSNELIRKNRAGSLITLCRTHHADLSSMEAQLSAFPSYELGTMLGADLMAQALVALRGARVYLEHELLELADNYEPRHEAVAEKLAEIAGHITEMRGLFEIEIDAAADLGTTLGYVS